MDIARHHSLCQSLKLPDAPDHPTPLWTDRRLQSYRSTESTQHYGVIAPPLRAHLCAALYTSPIDNDTDCADDLNLAVPLLGPCPVYRNSTLKLHPESPPRPDEDAPQSMQVRRPSSHWCVHGIGSKPGAGTWNRHIRNENAQSRPEPEVEINSFYTRQLWAQP